MPEGESNNESNKPKNNPIELLRDRFDLHATPEVAAAARLTERRSGQRVPQKPIPRIENYLNRFREIADREDPHKKEQGMEAIKRVVLGKFVTKFDEIPENFWKLQDRIIRERGQAGDWNQYTDEQKNQERKNQVEGVLDDQRASLEQWINYLGDPQQSNYMPDAMKYWAFRSVVGLQEYDKDKQEFPKRSKGTVKMFPDINHEALAYVIDKVAQKQEGQENIDLRIKDMADDELTDDQKQEFQKHLDTYNFAKLYAWANERIKPISAHLLPVTDGQWVKYDQDTEDTQNYKQLQQSLSGRGTGWCTAGEMTARSQLKGGDFYVYYSNDDDDNPTIPRIAIRQEKGKIAEVRGIAHKQNLDPYMGDVLEKKLEEFPDKEQYLKREADMKKLTQIERKQQAGEKLNPEEVSFLYEIDGKIEGFGSERDPRIMELRSQRNSQEDMSIIFDCDKEQIVTAPDQINENTKAYIGKLTPGLFDKLPAGIEHIYTSFPEGKIPREQLEIGGKPAQELKNELTQSGIRISGYAEEMLQSPDFTTQENPETIDLVRLKVGDLGLPGYPNLEQVYKKAKEFGLALCPPEVGPRYRLSHGEQATDKLLSIGMKQINDFGGDPRVFHMGHNDGGRWLYDERGGQDDEWDPYQELIFRFNK